MQNQYTNFLLNVKTIINNYQDNSKKTNHARDAKKNSDNSTNSGQIEIKISNLPNCQNHKKESNRADAQNGTADHIKTFLTFVIMRWTSERFLTVFSVA